jgi:hypothetical protein
MAVMESADESQRASPAVVLASLGTAALFEVLTVLATQDKTVRAASPWQDDPYDAVVSLAQFAVPMLALVIALRLFAWRAPGGPDRERQLARAAAAMLALIGLTLVSEWAAVIGRAHAGSWGTWTSVLVGGLIVASVVTGVVGALLVRRRSRGASGRWRHDWLGDVVLVCERIPVLRRWATPEVAAWVRRRAMTVFVTLSVLASVGIAGSLAVGERWTDPLLIAWALIAETASNLAFCVLTNAVAGFIARPARTRSRRVAETSVIAGCVAIQVAVAFRDALWPVVGVGSPSVPALVTLPLGTGFVTSLVTAGLLLARTSRPNPPGGDATAACSP